MPKRISVATHLSIDELRTRYRQACDPVAQGKRILTWMIHEPVTKVRSCVGLTGRSPSQRSVTGLG